MKTRKRYIVTVKDSEGIVLHFFWRNGHGDCSSMGECVPAQVIMTEHEFVQFSKWVESSDPALLPWCAGSSVEIKKKDIRVVEVVTTESRAMSLSLTMRKRADAFYLKSRKHITNF